MCYENLRSLLAAPLSSKQSVETGEFALQRGFKAVLIHAEHNAQMDRPGGNIDDVTNP